MPDETMQSVPRELVLGQVRAALRPSRLDPVEVREVLLTAAKLGHDPASIYAEALKNRPAGLDPAPPLTKVVPSEFLKRRTDPREEE